MTYEPVPQRLSDSDRDQAVDCLRQHYEAGRLDDAEFDERSSKALQARIAPEIDTLFSDLPDPRPTLGQGAGPQRFAGPPGLGAQNPPRYQALPWHQDQSAPQSPAPYTPGGYQADGFVSAQGSARLPEPRVAPPTWLRSARIFIWPVAILGGVFIGDLSMWIIMAVVVSIVLSQVGARTRRPPS